VPRGPAVRSAEDPANHRAGWPAGHAASYTASLPESDAADSGENRSRGNTGGDVLNHPPNDHSNRGPCRSEHHSGSLLESDLGYQAAYHLGNRPGNDPQGESRIESNGRSLLDLALVAPFDRVSLIGIMRTMATDMRSARRRSYAQ